MLVLKFFSAFHSLLLTYIGTSTTVKERKIEMSKNYSMKQIGYVIGPGKKVSSSHLYGKQITIIFFSKYFFSLRNNGAVDSDFPSSYIYRNACSHIRREHDIWMVCSNPCSSLHGLDSISQGKILK